ncbi:MAG: anthranilate synthase component I family protein [Nitrospiraceae bacterium]|nr:anthranilate synthase component I family protein [Nitrospiraceae bacterium]
MSAGGVIQPVYIEVEFKQPAAVYEHLKRSGAAGERSVLMQSAGGPESISRYSFICLDPYLLFSVKNSEVAITSFITGRSSVSFRPPLQRLAELVSAYRQKHVSGLPPFQGGAVGMFSYDFARYIENIPSNAVDDLMLPDAIFMMVDTVIAFDHKESRAWIISAPGARATALGYADVSTADLPQAYDESMKRIDMLSRLYSEATEATDTEYAISASEPVCEMPRAQYIDIVKRAKEYIAAGDIFQANLSLRINANIGDTDPWLIYKRLTAINPSPFAFYADFSDFQIASSSPERLVRVSGNIIDTRPIAGTRPRGSSIKEDEHLNAELLLNEKERAEHIMLIDLERNDISRVCEYGTVRVDELMVTERYSHVMHIVSNVRGRLKRSSTAFDAVKAVFPGGTITGVPKVRCMEIIDELEPVRRGAYTGSFGYIGFGGGMDLNIIIRTFLIKDRTAYIQAGAGIVADSDPDREYHEAMKKAEALLKTLKMPADA